MYVCIYIYIYILTFHLPLSNNRVGLRSEYLFHRRVETIGMFAQQKRSSHLHRLSISTTIVGTIGQCPFSQKYEFGHCWTVGTIGMRIRYKKYDREHNEEVTSVFVARHIDYHRAVGTIGSGQTGPLWRQRALSDQVSQARFCRTSRAIWPLSSRIPCTPRQPKHKFLYVCTCMVTHTYIHTYAHTHMHTYMHACMYAYMHAYIHAYIHTYTHTYTHTYIHAYIHACMHTYRHACVHTYIHTCMHACMHAYVHTYTDRQTDRQTD